MKKSWFEEHLFAIVMTLVFISFMVAFFGLPADNICNNPEIYNSAGIYNNAGISVECTDVRFVLAGWEHYLIAGIILGEALFLLAFRKNRNATNFGDTMFLKLIYYICGLGLIIFGLIIIYVARLVDKITPFLPLLFYGIVIAGMFGLVVWLNMKYANRKIKKK